MQVRPLKTRRQRKARRWIGILLGMLVLAVALPRWMLHGIGGFLIVEDDLQRSEAIFVLSGNSFDRGREAAEIYQAGWSPRIVCLGGETNPSLELYGICDLSYASTARVLLAQDVPASAIDTLPEGTSTFEEFEAIALYCKQHRLHRIIAVSSLFHTRRMDEFFRLRLLFEGIELILRGAEESSFDEEEWWREEPGLLFVSNEYIKLFYYWMRF
ncbi:MAG: hypothetical protein RLZZ165_581 [Bacteroidota bacterium]